LLLFLLCCCCRYEFQCPCFCYYTVATFPDVFSWLSAAVISDAPAVVALAVSAVATVQVDAAAVAIFVAADYELAAVFAICAVPNVSAYSAPSAAALLLTLLMLFLLLLLGPSLLLDAAFFSLSFPSFCFYRSLSSTFLFRSVSFSLPERGRCTHTST
jgi:hypothetical protein